MGSQNVSPRCNSVAARAASIATPSRLSIPTQAASNVPRPSGIGQRVAAIDAMMKLTKATQIAGVSPKPHPSGGYQLHAEALDPNAAERQFPSIWVCSSGDGEFHATYEDAIDCPQYGELLGQIT